MNRNPKRLRQMSLLESFGVNKKHKPDNSKMEETTIEEEPSLENKEEKIISSPQPILKDSLEICQAVEDSLQIGIKSNAADVEKCEEPVSEDDSPKPSADLFPSEPSEDNYSIPGSSNSSELLSDFEYKLSYAVPDSPPPVEEIKQMELLNRMPECCISLPKLEPLENHYVMFSPYIRPGDAPRPYPRTYIDRWGFNHVRMPCSPSNRYVFENSFGHKIIANRWEIINRSLNREISSSAELENAIMKYNSQYIGKWNFLSLHSYINDHLNEVEREYFFEKLLPAMVKMALDLPNICTQSVPLLKSGKDKTVTLSQKQIGCLLLNAFFCTYPRRTYPHSKKHMKYKWNSEYASYPEINFNRLFAGNKGERSTKVEKLKCLMNYFKRIITSEPCGTVTFHRQVIEEKYLPRWQHSSRGLRCAVIRSSGFIETDGRGMLQVDFANKYIGGGIIGHGCVQEEIRFAICPELIVSCLFAERLAHNEALIITGVEQYNKYSGYADSFKWEGDFKDDVPRDTWARKYTQLVAIDATSFKNPEVQFEIPHLKRELNKAYCGFYENAPSSYLCTVASGNWGCGVFKGNPNLKFVLQLMAASEAGRSLVYFTFGNKQLKYELQRIYKFLNDKNLTVGDCWRLLMSYSSDVSANNWEKQLNLHDYFHSQFTIHQEEDNDEVQLVYDSS